MERKVLESKQDDKAVVPQSSQVAGNVLGSPSPGLPQQLSPRHRTLWSASLAHKLPGYHLPSHSYFYSLLFCRMLPTLSSSFSSRWNCCWRSLPLGLGSIYKVCSIGLISSLLPLAWLRYCGNIPKFIICLIAVKVILTEFEVAPPLGLSVLRCVRLLRVFKVTR